MAVHELLENSIKYSSDGATNMSIELHSDERKRRVSIRAENRAAPERLAAVRETIERIRVALDPLELYCEMIRASVDRDANSGLGLVRICAEGACELDYSICGERLAIFAQTYIDRESKV